MGERIESGRCGEALGQGVHEFGIDDGNGRNIVRVDTNHLLLVLLVSNHVVDSHLGSRTGGGGQGNDGDRFLLGVGHPFERNHVAELGIVGDDADGLGRIHRRPTADSDDKVGPRSSIGGYPGLDIGDGRIGLDVTKNFIRDTGLAQHAQHLIGYAELDQVLVGSDKSLFQPEAGNLFGEHFPSSGSEVGDFV